MTCRVRSMESMENKDLGGEKTLVVATCASCNVRCLVLDEPLEEVVAKMKKAIAASDMTLENTTSTHSVVSYTVVPKVNDGMWGPIHLIRWDPDKQGTRMKTMGWGAPEVDAILADLRSTTTSPSTITKEEAVELAKLMKKSMKGRSS